jgi:hypothetical protein
MVLIVGTLACAYLEFDIVFPQKVAGAVAPVGVIALRRKTQFRCRSLKAVRGLYPDREQASS